MDGARAQQLHAQEPQAAEQQGAQETLGVAAYRHAPGSILGLSLTSSGWLGDAFAIFLGAQCVMGGARCQGSLSGGSDNAY